MKRVMKNVCNSTLIFFLMVKNDKILGVVRILHVCVSDLLMGNVESSCGYGHLS